MCGAPELTVFIGFDPDGWQAKMLGETQRPAAVHDLLIIGRNRPVIRQPQLRRMLHDLHAGVFGQLEQVAIAVFTSQQTGMHTKQTEEGSKAGTKVFAAQNNH